MSQINVNKKINLGSTVYKLLLWAIINKNSNMHLTVFYIKISLKPTGHNKYSLFHIFSIQYLLYTSTHLFFLLENTSSGVATKHLSTTQNV